MPRIVSPISPRYLKALKIRAERGAYDREKDQEKGRPDKALHRGLAQKSSRHLFQSLFGKTQKLRRILLDGRGV